MGAGNPLLRSFDQEMYEPNTFFIDFTQLTELEDEDDNYEYRSLLAQDNYEFFKELDFLELDFNIPESKTISELSAEYSGSAIVLAEFEYGLLLTTSGSELHHLAIGMIPNFKYEDSYDEMYDKYEKSMNWYSSMNKDYEVAVNRYAYQHYRRKLKKFKSEGEIIMKKIHDYYGHEMSERNGAWCSSSIKELSHNFKFL